jgi:predicted DNA-binding transcriptional regulator AlpA
MRKFSDAHPNDNKQDERGDRVAGTGNRYAAVKGLAEPGPSEDEYASQMAGLIARLVVDLLLPKIGTAQKPDRTSAATAPAAVKAEQLLTDNEVAALFKVSKQTIWRWIKTSEGFPKPLKVEKGSTRWRLSEVVAYEARMAGER